MNRISASLLLAALLPLQALAQPLGLTECRSLRARRDQIASEAMQAEIALVIATRRRLCPQQEALAERANANANPQPDASTNANAARQGGLEEFDYSAYLECRRRAELQLRRSRPVLYTNQRGFSFYTSSGARLARQADALQPRLDADCGPAG